MFRVKAILDANRNSLMLLDLKFSIGTLGIGSGAFFAGLWGMNLKNFMEESDMGFLCVMGGSTLCAVAICLYSLRKLRKVQRVSMWGREREQHSRATWNEVESLPQSLYGEIQPERLKRLKAGTSGKVEMAQLKQ